MQNTFHEEILSFYQWIVDYWWISIPVGVALFLLVIIHDVIVDIILPLALRLQSPKMRALFAVLGFFWSRLARRKDLFGKAKWAEVNHLRRAGMLKPGGLFLGALKGNDIFQHGEGHILTIAPPGSGKTTGLVIPTILEWRDGSMVITDPSAELTAQTARARSRYSKVVILNPWRRGMKEDTGIDFGDTGFNPLSFLSDSPELSTEARLVAALLLPEHEAVKDPMWISLGRDLLTGLITAMVRRMPESEQTLPVLWTLLRSGEGLVKSLRLMAEDKDRTIKAYGNQFLALSETRNTWQGVLTEAQRAVAIYEPGEALAEHVSRDEFDLGDLKRENVTVYLLIPSRRILSHGAWLNLIMALIAETVGKPGPMRPVAMICDEFQNLGTLPSLQAAMAQYRKAGLRVWLLAQTMGKMLKLYGPHGFADLMGQCDTKQVFSVNDQELAELVSKWVGERTVTRTRFGGASEMVGAPLIRPEEIRAMPKGQQIIVRTGLDYPVPPIKGQLVPYFKRRKWKNQVDPHPTHDSAGARKAWARPVREIEYKPPQKLPMPDAQPVRETVPSRKPANDT